MLMYLMSSVCRVWGCISSGFVRVLSLLVCVFHNFESNCSFTTFCVPVQYMHVFVLSSFILQFFSLLYNRISFCFDVFG